jgi:hypothetical protein
MHAIRDGCWDSQRTVPPATVAAPGRLNDEDPGLVLEQAPDGVRADSPRLRDLGSRVMRLKRRLGQKSNAHYFLSIRSTRDGIGPSSRGRAEGRSVPLVHSKGSRIWSVPYVPGRNGSFTWGTVQHCCDSPSLSDGLSHYFKP